MNSINTAVVTNHYGMLGDVASDQFAGQSASRSNRYRVLDTEALVTHVLTNLGMNASLRTIAPRGKSTRHAVVIRLSTPVMLAGTECYPQIYVRNSYAGESALIVQVGFYRLVCSNGMVVGTDHYKGRITHTNSGISQLAALQASIVDAVQWCTSELAALAARLDSVTLSLATIDRLLVGMGLSKRTTERVQDALRYPYMMRQEDRRTDGTFSAWNLWNIINEQQRRSSRSELRQLDANMSLLNVIEAEVSQSAA